MKALVIKDELLWHPSSANKIGTLLEVKDSSNNLIIFSGNPQEDEILKLVADSPKESYEIIDLTEAPEKICDFLTDSGTCYRQVH